MQSNTLITFSCYFPEVPKLFFYVPKKFRGCIHGSWKVWYRWYNKVGCTECQIGKIEDLEASRVMISCVHHDHNILVSVFSNSEQHLSDSIPRPMTAGTCLNAEQTCLLLILSKLLLLVWMCRAKLGSNIFSKWLMWKQECPFLWFARWLMHKALPQAAGECGMFNHLQLK